MDVLLGAGANAGFTGDAFPAAQAGFLQLQAHRALLFTGIAARDAAVALPVQPRKWQHRQQGKHRSHGAEELTEEPGMHRHTQQNEHKQPDAHTKALRRQMQSRQAGKHLPRACAGQHLFLPGHIQCYQPCQQQIFDLLPQKHRPLRQTELLFAVEQLLNKPGKRPDGIAQAAEGAGVPTEKTVEKQGEAAQPQQAERSVLPRKTRPRIVGFNFGNFLLALAYRCRPDQRHLLVLPQYPKMSSRFTARRRKFLYFILLLLPFQIQSRSLPAAVPARMSAALPQKMPVPVQRMPVHLPGKAAAILP